MEALRDPFVRSAQRIGGVVIDRSGQEYISAVPSSIFANQLLRSVAVQMPLPLAQSGTRSGYHLLSCIHRVHSEETHQRVQSLGI